MSDTLIPFAPSVAQLHRLALEHWRAGQQLDALGLMRRALSLEEDNVEYRAALARFLTNAGCLAESTYVLAREYPRLLHFGFPLMFLYLSIDTSNEMGLLLALLPRVQSLKWFLTNVPKESLHKTALIVSQTTGASRTLICHSNRLRFIRTLLLRGETARLLRWLEALRMRSGKKYSSIYRSMECVALCVSGQQEKARAVLQELRRDPRDPSLFPPAETLHVGPQDGLVSQLFTRPENFRLLAEAMCGEIPADCCPADENPWHNLSAFNRSTHDSLALHLMAVTAYNAGAPASLAAEFWNHIARLHPDDPVAEELYHCAIRDALPPRPMPYTWRLSEHSAGQNLALVSSVCALDAEELNCAWAQDSAFRRALHWVMRAENDAFAQVFPALCQKLTLEHLHDLVNDFCYATEQNGAHLLSLLAALPEKTQRAFCRSAFAGFSPASLKRMLAIRTAQSGLEHLQGLAPDAFLLWLDAGIRRRHGRNIHGHALLLAWRYLGLIEKDIDVRRLARALNVSPRLAEYRVRTAKKEIRA